MNAGYGDRLSARSAASVEFTGVGFAEAWERRVAVHLAEAEQG